MVKPIRPVAIVLVPIILCGPIGWPGRSSAQPGPDRAPASAAKVDLFGDPLPPGAMLRLGTVKYRQDSPIYRIAWTPDGKQFVTDGEDSILRVWDAATGRAIRRIDPGVGALEDYAIARRGNLVMAVGASREPGLGLVQNVTLTHLGTGRIEDRGSWPDPPGIDPIALCPDRRLVAIGGRPNGVRVLDAWNGAEVVRFDTGEHEAERLVFSRDGRRLAVELRVGEPGAGVVELRVFDLARKQEARAIRQPGYLDGLALAPDGSTVAATYGADLSVWVVATGERIPFDKAFVGSLSYSEDGRILAGIAGFGLVGAFDLTGRKVIASFRTGVDGTRELALSPDGRTVLGVSAGGVVHCWDLGARRDRFAIPDAHQEPVEWILSTPDGKTLITGSRDQTLRSWDLGDGRSTRVMRLSGAVEVATLSTDGRWLAAATNGFHQVFAWDLRDQRGPVVLAYGRGQDTVSPRAMRFTGDHTVFLVDSSGKGHSLDVRERWVAPGVALQLPPPDPDFALFEGNRISRAEFLADGKRLAALGLFDEALIFNLDTGRPLVHAADGNKLAASPDARLLAIAASSGDERKARRSDHISGHQTGLNIVPTGGTIHLLDAGTGRALRRVHVEGSEVWAMAFAPDGKTLAATSGWDSGEIHFYEVESGRETRTIVGPPFRSPALTFTPDGSRLVTGMADGSVLVWDVRPGPSGR